LNTERRSTSKITTVIVVPWEMSDVLLNPNSRIKVSEDQVSSYVSGEAVILNLKTGAYHSLNSVGSRIWQLIQEPKTFLEILNILLAEYDVELHICEQDLHDILKKLEEAQLIEIFPVKMD
jgi:Coenzyme PQQ synthesis protein D (PqqD)